MSLAVISGKTKSINVGASIGRTANASFATPTFLRNSGENIVSFVASAANVLTDLASATGVRSSMYKIGEIEEDSSFWTGLKNKAIRAVSFGFLDNGLVQKGVIIDGFDNFRGDINVALAEQPVMYKTSVTDNRVRNSNRLTMRIYVDLVHSDDLAQDLWQQIKDGLGGLVGEVIGVLGGDTATRAQTALSNLQYIQENGMPFKVYTPHKIYESMMIEKISPVNDLKMNEILAADITFKEIIYAKSLSSGVGTPSRLAPSAAISTAAKVYNWIF